MKLSVAVSALSATIGVNGQSNDFLGRRPHMWTFGNAGVQIYTPDGSEIVKSIPPERACHNTGTTDAPDLQCSFLDVVSDGHKYVWASINRGHDMIDVFTIDSGSFVGSFATCGSPRDLDLHAGREELWVHCSDFSAMEESHMDVFSIASPAVPIQSRILMHDNTEARSFGQLEVDESLGDIGYATVYGQNYVNKINLSERTVLEQIDINNGNPKLNGLYEMTYSPVNQHLYIRTQVCCTCGFQGADSLECGRYGSSNITISGQTVEGQCGRHCVGSPADNIGIFEYDTLTDTVVGTHAFVGEAAVVAPFASPDGSQIVIPGMNGGHTLQILTPGANGQLTTNKQALQLDFDTAVDEEISAYEDFAWIKTNDLNLFVLASAIDFKAAIVDMSQSTPSVSYVTLSDQAWPAEARARTRQVEWVEGTDYVWIGGHMEGQTYVIDVRKKSLVKTISHPGSEIYKLLSVRNHYFASFAAGLNQHWEETGVWNSNRGNGGGGSSSGSSGSSSSALLRGEEAGGNSGDGKGVSIAALAISCVAVVAVITNFAFSREKAASSTESLAGKKSVLPPSVA